MSSETQNESAALDTFATCRPCIPQSELQLPSRHPSECMQALSLSERIDLLPKRCCGGCNIFESMTWALFARELLQKLSCDLHNCLRLVAMQGLCSGHLDGRSSSPPVPVSKHEKHPPCAALATSLRTLTPGSMRCAGCCSSSTTRLCACPIDLQNILCPSIKHKGVRRTADRG